MEKKIIQKGFKVTREEEKMIVAIQKYYGCENYSEMTLRLFSDRFNDLGLTLENEREK